MKVLIASDHGGYELKEEIVTFLTEQDIDFDDLGTYSVDSVDYPDYAKKVVDELRLHNGETRGILVCGTGVGISIAANKFKGIRAALCSDVFTAKMSRLHNDANILVMGGRVIGPGIAVEITKVWLETEFEGGRHQNRLDKIKQFED